MVNVGKYANPMDAMGELELATSTCFLLMFCPMAPYGYGHRESLLRQK